MRARNSTPGGPCSTARAPTPGAVHTSRQTSPGPGRAWYRGGMGWSPTGRIVPAVLVAAAVALRVLAAARAQVIESDGAYYASLAAALLRGDLRHALSTVWPPLYPLLIAAAAWVPHALGVVVTPELLERAARGVSMAAGLALLPLVDRLARRLAGDRAALAALAFAAVHPRLVQYSGAALTESLYAALLVGGVLAWTAGHRARAGVALGLATLTRPEGIAAAALLAAGGALERRARGATPWRGFLPALLLVILPYVAFVTLRTGTPSLGEKGEYNFWRAYKSEYSRVLPAPLGLSERVVDSPELTDRLPRGRVEAARFVLRAPGAVARRTLRNAGVIVASSLPLAIYPAFAMLAVVGALVLPWRRAWPATGMLPLYILVYAPLAVDRRFFVPVIPFALVLGSAGAMWLGRPRAAWAGARLPALGVALIVLLVAGHGVYAGLRGRPIDEAPEHRDAGRWLREHPLPPGPGTPDPRPEVVMSRKPWVAYYAGALNAELPEGSSAELRERIRSVGADVLVVDDRWAVPRRPALEALRDPRRAPDGMRLLHAWPGPMPLLLYDVRALRARR